MDVFRTPDARFARLADWPYEPHYVETGDGLRVSFVDEGPRDATPVLMLHGEPTWSYLYRHVLAEVLGSGLRGVAVDLVGFGRSDKPTSPSDYTYARHVTWLRDALDAMGLPPVVLVGQDWGGFLGLRLVADDTDRFAGVVASNTGLRSGDADMPPEWWRFHDFVQRAEELPVGFLVSRGCRTPMSEETKAAYDAPYPTEESKAGARAFPTLVPTRPDDPEHDANAAAWQRLASYDKPFVCAFSDGDPITGAMGPDLAAHVRGARGREHPTLRGGHFVQEDDGAALGRVAVAVAREVERS